MKALVDPEDYDSLAKHKWGIQSDWGYAKRSERRNGKITTFLMHRVVMKAPKGVFVDHINHNGLDNRKANLRFCNNRQNLGNCRKRVTNTSGYKGVCRSKSRGKWTANAGCRPIGYFDTPEEAARAYDKRARELYGEFACVNFPNEVQTNHDTTQDEKK
jgi:hypothetical protein